MDKNKNKKIEDQLLISISDNNLQKVKELIKLGVDINIESTVGRGNVPKYGYKPYTPLMLAAEEGYVEIVRELLRSPGIDVNIKNYYGVVALHFASSYGHVDVVKMLLAVKGIEINITDKYGFSPLMLAARANKAEVIKILLSTPEIEINKVDGGGKTALHQAASSGREEAVQVLLKDQRISVNLQDDLNGHTALHLAVDFHHEKVVRALLNHPNIDVNVQDKYGQTALHTSAYHGDVNVVEMLLISGIDINKKMYKDGSTAMYWAEKQKQVKVVEMITQHIQLRKILGFHQRIKNVQVSEKSIDYDEILPINKHLLQASQNGNLEKVAYLLKQPGIDVNSLDQNQNTPLHLAAEEGHAGVVKILLECEDVNVNAKNLDKSELMYPIHPGDNPDRKKLTMGKSALFLAVKNGHFEVVKLLVNHKAIDVNSKDKYDESCIHSAVQNSIEITKLLLNHVKIDPNVQYTCNDHYTALHTATERGDMEMIKVLLSHPDIDLNVKEKYKGLTAFHMAVKNNIIPVVEIMLQNPRIDVNIVDKFGQTPLYTCVTENRNINLVEMLLKAGARLQATGFKDLISSKIRPGNNYSAIIQMIADYTRGVEKRYADINLTTNQCLVAAAQNGDLQRFKKLLEQPDVDVNYMDENENTCLHLAAERGHVEIVKELLKISEIVVNAINKDDSKYIYPIHFGDDPDLAEINVGKTPLYYAVNGGHLEVVKLLVDHYKIDVNAKDKYEKSCIFLAVFKGYTRIVQALLRHPKIDVNAKYICYDHYTPLHIAVEKNQLEIVQALLNHPNIDVNIKERLNEYTPLHMAANYGHSNMLKYMISHRKINVNLKDKFGRTALKVAKENKHQLFVNILMNTRLPA